MDKRIRYIADYYGKDIHKLKCCEECAELIQAILKGNIKNIISEMADVMITIKELEYHYGLDEGQLEKMMEFKIDRQIARIEEEQNEVHSESIV